MGRGGDALGVSMHERQRERVGVRSRVKRNSGRQVRRAGARRWREAEGVRVAVAAIVVRVGGGHRVADPEALLLVSLQHVGEPEALPANVAGVRLLSRVRPPVALHVGPAGEAFPTDLTDVRLLA